MKKLIFTISRFFLGNLGSRANTTQSYVQAYSDPAAWAADGRSQVHYSHRRPVHAQPVGASPTAAAAALHATARRHVTLRFEACARTQ